MKIAIVNGPNLNLIGKREPSIYGDQSLDTYLAELESHVDCELLVFQSNVEGELINHLHALEADASVGGVVINAGAYTHTSIAIGDAVRAMDTPVIEVHISNVMARERERQKSYISAAAKGSIVGLGLDVYRLAVLHLLQGPT